MDLDGFGKSSVQTKANLKAISKARTAKDALQVLDDVWYSEANRLARWMDLIGDYAGNELFVIDGDSLIQNVLEDPLLALGRADDLSFQIVHAKYSLEKTVQEFVQRAAVFEIAIWDDHRYRTTLAVDPVLAGDSFVMTSRLHARSMLVEHLRKLNVPVHTFTSQTDDRWHQYLKLRKPMYIMLNDGGSVGSDDGSPEHVLMQRLIMFSFISTGLACATLRGAEFRDSKILTFVFGRHLDGGVSKLVMSPRFQSIVTTTIAELEKAERAVRDAFTPASITGSSEADDGAAAERAIARFIDVATHNLGTGCPHSSILIFVFVAHLLLLPRLSINNRCRAPTQIHPGLEELLRETFLPTIFLSLETSGPAIDVDGRVFLTFLQYMIEHAHSKKIVGQRLFAEAATYFSILDASTSLRTLAASFPNPPARGSDFLLTPDPPSALSVLPFSNDVFDDILSSIQLKIDEDEQANPSATNEFMVPIVDDRHWHNQRRAILPKHLGGSDANILQETEWQRKRRLRGEQRFMAKMQWQAESLTGASGKALQRMTIVAGKQTKKSKEVSQGLLQAPISKGKKVHVSKAELIRQQIATQKRTEQNASNETWWKDQLIALEPLSLDGKITRIERLLANSRAESGWLAVEMRIYRLHLEFLRWIEDLDALGDEDDEVAKLRDRYSVSIVRMVKALFVAGDLFPSALSVLETALRALGLADFTSSLQASSPSPSSDDRKLAFKIVKLVRSKTQAARYPGMRITEDPVSWQMRLFGEYMDRSMDSQEDSRVSFQPDAWQRRVLDCLDRDHSLLVVAPTSAGKTFISFYAMEQVLRGSDDGVLVYVAPTKALVSQIAAEVYARFNKTFKASGKTCWSIHTRDYKVNDPQNCQILVTVPEMLAIMLLSPPLARSWVPRIKRIILDEIHSIGQQEGGAVWEQIILLAPCPIIGLSATIGHPEAFNAWLESVQHVHGYEHTFIDHKHRYSHLRKFHYAIHAATPKSFTGLDVHQDTRRLRFLHPVSMLEFGARKLPPDFSLEAADCLSLYRALEPVRQHIDTALWRDLEPKRFFSQHGFLKQKDVISYEDQLKKALVQVMDASDVQDDASALAQVVRALQDEANGTAPNTSRDSEASPDQALKNLVFLVSDLHANGDLPALFFMFDRGGCEVAAQRLYAALKNAEVKWRASNLQWQKKVEQWKLWHSQAEARARTAAKLAKANKKEADDPRNKAETSWEESFDPRDPNPQFSLLGKKASKQVLEEAIRDIAWTSTPEWVLHALRRGVGVHHAGMNKHYRTTVESLYRMGYVQVVFATGTLALGINAPTKTSVFFGDSPFLTALMYRQCAGRAGRRGYDLLGKVVFYGLNMNSVQRLVLSKLPTLGGTFPLTSTMILRLFNLLQGSQQAPVAVKAIQSILKLPRVSSVSVSGREEILHHVRFSIDYLRRFALMDANGNPINLFGIATHLYYTEPSNFAIVALLRGGVLHDICAEASIDIAKENLLQLLCHLFGRRYVSKVYTSSRNVKELLAKSPSKVILSPMPDAAREVLEQQDREALKIFAGYARTFAHDHQDSLGIDHTLPLSGTSFIQDPKMHNTPFCQYLERTALQTKTRSPFVANSGNSDDFTSVEELVNTVRAGVHLKEHGIPSLAHLTGETTHPLNAYLLDFYIHGQTEALVQANGIRRGDLWYLLQDFVLTLKTIRAGLEQLLTSMSAAAGDVNADDAYADVENIDPAEADDDETDPHAFKRPSGISNRDWKVFEVFDALTKDYEEKFRGMWA